MSKHTAHRTLLRQEREVWGAKRKPFKDMEWQRGSVLGERVGCHVMELKRKVFWDGRNNTEPPIWSMTS